MKGSSVGFLASFLTVSSVALSSCSAGDRDVVSDRSSFQEQKCELHLVLNPPLHGTPIEKFDPVQMSRWSSSSAEENEHGWSKKEKFAPRFDGMRFIETLITAHR